MLLLIVCYDLHQECRSVSFYPHRMVNKEGEYALFNSLYITFYLRHEGYVLV